MRASASASATTNSSMRLLKRGVLRHNPILAFRAEKFAGSQDLQRPFGVRVIAQTLDVADSFLIQGHHPYIISVKLVNDLQPRNLLPPFSFDGVNAMPIAPPEDFLLDAQSVSLGQAPRRQVFGPDH